MSSKEKILEAATALFYQQGYLATSVDTIIEQADVSKSNFYYHFKSKEDLGMVVLAERQREFLATFERILLAPDLPPRQRLLNYVGYLIEMQNSRMGKGGCPFGNLVAEMADHSERFRCKLSCLFDGMTQTFAAVITEGQDQGAFWREADAQDAAVLFVQATQGMLLMTKCHKSIARLERGARLLVDLMGR